MSKTDSPVARSGDRATTRDKADSFLGWPGWDLVRYSLLWGAALTLWFALVFGGAEYVTVQRSFRVRLHLTAELDLPFVPVMVLGYLAIYPVFWAAPFILRSRRQITALIGTMAAVIFIGGIGFLLFPGELLFPPPQGMGRWTGLILFAKHLALRHNLMPSLHVALSAVCLLVYASRTGLVGKCLLGLVGAVIGLSTLLLHQHYLVDVVTGYALAWAATRWLYQSWSKVQQGAGLSSRQGSPGCRDWTDKTLSHLPFWLLQD